MTYTYALLQVSDSAYDEIAAKLRAAGYHQAFHVEPGEPVRIDMHGIALTSGPDGLDQTQQSDACNCEQSRLLQGELNLERFGHAEDMVTINAIEAACIAHGYDADAGEPLAQWLARTLPRSP